MRDTTQVPNYDKYRSKSDEVTNRVFQYFVVGTMGGLTAMGAKATVQGMSSIVRINESKNSERLNDVGGYKG